MSEAVDRILGGGGHPSCTFLEVGRTYEGVIVDDREVQAREFGTKEPKVWPSGDPMMVAVFDLQTDENDTSIEDDDGIRSLYVDKRSMREAVAQAFRDAKLGRGSSVQGGTLKVQFVGYGEGKNPANPPKLFRAKFTPAPRDAVTSVMDDYSDFGEEPF